MTAATALADELMCSAIVAAADAGDPVKSVDADRIRNQAETNFGNVAGRQPLQERFPWVAQVLSLHTIRQAHATKKGQARPSPVTEKDRANARTLLGMILTGWLDSMNNI